MSQDYGISTRQNNQTIKIPLPDICPYISMIPDFTYKQSSRIRSICCRRTLIRVKIDQKKFIYEIIHNAVKKEKLVIFEETIQSTDLIESSDYQITRQRIKNLLILILYNIDLHTIDKHVFSERNRSENTTYLYIGATDLLQYLIDGLFYLLEILDLNIWTICV